MKKTYFYLLIIIGTFLVTLSSCSTSQTFMVQGVPGTVISSPTNQRLAVLDNMGQAQIKTKRKEGYYHYLQAQVPGSNLQVPFALDYNNHSRATGRSAEVLGGSFLLSAGIFGCVYAGIVALAGDFAEVGGGIATGAGLGGLLIGGIIMADGNSKDNAGINHDYDYQKLQSTNSDILR